MIIDKWLTYNMEFAVRKKHTSSPILEFGPDEYRVDIQCNVKNRTGVLPC